MKQSRSIVMAFIIVAFLFPGFSVSSAYAANSNSPDPFSGNLRFERLTVEDGLPHATVLSVLQDRQGFMWFATANGLARYDGSTFTIYKHDINNPNSLSNNNTFSLIESSDGLLWIGTDPGGLSILNPDTGNFQFYKNKENDPNSLANDSIWSLMEAQDGKMWIGTRGGVSVLDRKTNTFKNYVPNKDNPRALGDAVVYRIYQDRQGTIWLGTRAGLHRYDPETDDFTIFKNDPKDPQSISHNNVWAMLEDRNGDFLVGTRGGGLNLFDRAAGTFTSYRNDPNNQNTLSNDRIWNLYEDRDGNFWILTENGGLNLFNTDMQIFRSFQNNPNDTTTVSNNDLYWITEDTSGILWITSRYGGVNKLYPSLQRFGLYRSIPGNPNSLSSNNVYSVWAEKDGLIWIGTFGGGLNLYNRNSGTMTLFKNDPGDPESISNNKIQNIYKDDQGYLWLATSGGGLNRLDPSTGKFKIYKSTPNDVETLGSNFLTMIKPAGYNHLWIGTLGFGLNLFNTETGKVEKVLKYEAGNSHSLTEDTIYDISVAQDGKLWIATARGGLELLDPVSGEFTHHRNDPSNPNSILDDAVFAIYLNDDTDMVWAGTSNGLSGLNLKTGRWENYTMKDGLPADTVVGIQPGSGNDLWISTGKGISHFIIEKKLFENYSVRDGLQGDLFEIASSHRGPDGEIFFGGSNGVTFFRPDQIVKNTYKPPVALTDFQLFNQSVPVGSEVLTRPIEKTEKVTLRHDQSVITIKFAAQSYQLPQKNLYSYKLGGFDKDWSPARTKNEATYTNLPPGNYTFHVRASNNDGVWNEESDRVLHITILSPWWQSWWFITLAVLGILGLLYSGIQLRTNAVQARNVELEKRVTERTKELEESQNRLNQVNQELTAQLEAVTELEKEVRELAIHDALTGLFNRHYLSERLESEYSRAERASHPISFLLMDIDHFKDINDTYGHQAGDYALKTIAQIIMSQIRKSDIACRFGGEEFMIILPNTDMESAVQKADAFRQSISDRVYEFGGKKFSVTISIGIAVYPVHGTENDRILSKADAALYEAKRAGRNRVVVSQE